MASEFDDQHPAYDVVDGVYGYWRQDHTPEGGGGWGFIPDTLEGEDAGTRIRRVNRELEKAKTADEKKVDATVAASRWCGDHPEEPPVLRIRCVATSAKGKACRSVAANVWKTPSGYLLSGLIYPFTESRMADVNLAMAARDDGHPLLQPLAQMSEAVATENIPLPVIVNLSSPTITMPGDWFTDARPRVLFGCEHHGNQAHPIDDLLNAARANVRSGNLKRDVEFNPQSGDVV